MGIPQKPKIKYPSFHRLSVITVIALVAATVIYMAIGLVLHSYIENVPCHMWRSLVMISLTINGSIFAVRCWRYTEFGGDYALAGRSAALVLVTVAVSAAVESYYLIPNITFILPLKLPLFFILTLAGLIPAIPYVLFLLFDFRVSAMVTTNSIYAGYFVLMMAYRVWLMLKNHTFAGSTGFLRSFALAINYLPPIYFVLFFLSAIMILVAVINYRKEVSYFEKIYPDELVSLESMDS